MLIFIFLRSFGERNWIVSYPATAAQCMEEVERFNTEDFQQAFSILQSVMVRKCSNV